MFLFLVLALSKKPIILVPGLYGSNLYVSYDKKAQVPWYCPKRMDDELLWIRTKYIIPPFINCIARLTQTQFDNDSQTLRNIPGVNITVKDFGGHASVDYVVKNHGKYNENNHKKPKGILTFFDNFKSMMNHFTERGYKIRRDFFVAPYDWRIAPLFIDDYWMQLRNLIENAYNQANGQKVTFLGFSMGCFMIQQFLASQQLLENSRGKFINGRPLWTSVKDQNVIVTDEWKQKYIEKVIFIAPSFGGTLKTFDGMIRRFSPLIPFYRTEYIADMSTSIPGFYSHWPNLQIFNGLDVVRGPDGRNYTVDQLRDLVFNYSNIRPEYVPIMDIAIDLQRYAPIDIGEKIPLAIIYNSRIQTTTFLDYKNGWDHDPIRITDANGDGSVPARGIRYACQNWNAEKRNLICIDLEKDDPKMFEHGSLPVNPLVLDLIYNATNGNPENGQQQWWTKKGKIDVNMNQFQQKNVFLNF